MGIINSILNFFGKLWKKLKKLLVIALIVFAICFALGWPFLIYGTWLGTAATWLGFTVTATTALSGTAAALASLGLALLIAPKETADAASDGLDAIGTVAKKAVDVTADVVGSAASAFTPLLIGVAGLFGVVALIRKKRAESAGAPVPAAGEKEHSPEGPSNG